MSMIEPIRYQNGAPMLLAGLRRHYTFASSAAGIPVQWQQFAASLPLPGQIGATTYGVICGASDHDVEYMSAVQVETFSELPVDSGRMRIEAQRYAVFLHRGHVSTLRHTWAAIIDNWLPNADVVSAHKPDFEVYDQRFDAAYGSGDIEIWIAVTENRR